MKMSIFDILFDYIEEKNDFINLALVCKESYESSKRQHIYYRVFSANTTCAACDMSKCRFFSDLDEAYDYVEDSRKLDEKLYLETGQRYDFIYRIEKCFAPPWLSDYRVKILEFIQEFEEDFDVYSDESDEE